MQQKHPSKPTEPPPGHRITLMGFWAASEAPRADSRMQVWKGFDGLWRINWEGEKHPCYASYTTQTEAFRDAFEIVSTDRSISLEEVEACS